MRDRIIVGRLRDDAIQGGECDFYCPPQEALNWEWIEQALYLKATPAREKAEEMLNLLKFVKYAKPCPCGITQTTEGLMFVIKRQVIDFLDTIEKE